MKSEELKKDFLALEAATEKAELAFKEAICEESPYRIGDIYEVSRWRKSVVGKITAINVKRNFCKNDTFTAEPVLYPLKKDGGVKQNGSFTIDEYNTVIRKL